MASGWPYTRIVQIIITVLLIDNDTVITVLLIDNDTVYKIYIKI